jgi:YD repeat-containing protein
MKMTKCTSAIVNRYGNAGQPVYNNLAHAVTMVWDEHNKSTEIELSGGIKWRVTETPEQLEALTTS